MNHLPQWQRWKWLSSERRLSQNWHKVAQLLIKQRRRLYYVAASDCGIKCVQNKCMSVHLNCDRHVSYFIQSIIWYIVQKLAIWLTRGKQQSIQKRLSFDSRLVLVWFSFDCSFIKRDTILLANRIANKTCYHSHELFIVLHDSKPSLFSMRYNDKKSDYCAHSLLLLSRTLFFTYNYNLCEINCVPLIYSTCQLSSHFN